MMAFDVTNPADLLALKTEVNDDPLNMGYNPDVSTKQLLKQLNDPDNNVGGEVAGQRLTIRLLLSAISADPDGLTETGQFTEGELSYLRLVVASGGLEDDIEEYRGALTSMWQANAAIRLSLETQNRAISRVEVLFGVGTNISRADWIAARES